MTYKHLKQFIENNTTVSCTPATAKIKSNFNTNIIFIVGEDASNVASFLSSIMSAKSIGHARYINSDRVELKDRFLQNGVPVDTKDITRSAGLLLRRTQKLISNEELLCGVALEILENVYLLFEVSYPCCKELFKNTKIIPHTLILTSNDDEKNEDLINLAPVGTGEIISATSKENFDYISTTKSKLGTRISYVSQNKITIFTSKLLGGTQFFYFNDLFRIPSINLCNVYLAALAVEAARVSLSLPNHRIRSGLKKSRLIYDLKLHSLSPKTLINVGNREFKLHHNLKYKVIEK